MEVALDPGEKRWEHNRLVGRAVPAGGVIALNATATPLDAYRHATIITARQFDAGNSLRDNWIRAGRQPRLTVMLEGGGGGSGEVSDERDRAQTRAWKRVAAKLKQLDVVTASCVWNVCCMEEGAEAWAARMGKPGHVGLVVLKDGLSAIFAGSGNKRRES